MTKIGFTCSSFDLLHAGHILMLQEAKTVCDYLIVGLQIDPTIDRPNKNKPVQSLLERQIQLSACKYVDEIVTYSTESELKGLLYILPINVRIIGSDYEGKQFTGDSVCEDLGIEIYYNKRHHNLSSTNLRQKIMSSSSSADLVPSV